jgi:hypothetical protein
MTRAVGPIGVWSLTAIALAPITAKLNNTTSTSQSRADRDNARPSAPDGSTPTPQDSPANSSRAQRDHNPAELVLPPAEAKGRTDTFMSGHGRAIAGPTPAT